jgi:hypothetical protein
MAPRLGLPEGPAIAAMPLVVSADIQYWVVPPAGAPVWAQAPAAATAAIDVAAAANKTDFI